MSEPHDLSTLAGRRAAFDAWSERKKRELGRFAGLRLSRTNVPGQLTFARHWPHLLCWSWSLWFGLYRPWKTGERWFGAYRIRHNSGGGQAGLRLGVVSFTFSRQAYDRIPALGPIGRDAPSIHPDTQTRRKEPT